MRWFRRRVELPHISEIKTAEEMAARPDHDLVQIPLELARQGHYFAAEAEMMRRLMRSMRSATRLSWALLFISAVLLVVAIAQLKAAT